MNEYFRNIAIELLNHKEEEPSFFREYSSAKIMLGESDFLQRLRTAQDRVLISQINGDIRPTGSNTVREHGAIWLLQRVAVTDFDTIDTVKQELIEMWKTIKKRIEKDIQTGALAVWSFDWQIIPVGRIADNYWGISVVMSWEKAFC